MGQIDLRFKEAINDIQQYVNFDATFINNELELTCDEILGFVKQYDGNNKPISEKNYQLLIVLKYKNKVFDLSFQPSRLVLS